MKIINTEAIFMILTLRKMIIKIPSFRGEKELYRT